MCACESNQAKPRNSRPICRRVQPAYAGINIPPPEGTPVGVSCLTTPDPKTGTWREGRRTKTTRICVVRIMYVIYNSVYFFLKRLF